MAFTQSFTVSNNSVNTNTFSVTDTSSGADPLIANRLLYIYLYDNSLFTGAPIQFPLSAGSSISPAILTQDFAANFVLIWVDSGGNMLYSSSQIFDFTGFLEWYFYGLIQQIAANNSILRDNLFTQNLGQLRTLIDSANQAISIGASVYNSQSMILLAQNMVNNQNLFF
jgi:hypothetical protein